MDLSNIAHGTPEAYREFIYEALAMAQVHAQLGTTYAAIGNDAGLQFAIRQLVAYTRSAVTVLRDLKEMKEASHAE